LTGASNTPTDNTLREIDKALDVNLLFILYEEEMNIYGLSKDQMNRLSVARLSMLLFSASAYK
jgi:hypothetical protein